MPGNKVRIYDMAQELKQSTKRVMEELRREGVDVSVPSNSVSKELADKIRSKYFPKKETQPARGIKVIKKSLVAEETPTLVEPSAAEPAQPFEELEKEENITPALAKEAAEEQPKTSTKILRRKKQPPVAPAEIVAEPVREPEEIQPAIEAATEEKSPVAPVSPAIETKTEEKPNANPVTSPRVFKPTGKTIQRKLTLTPEALKQGFKQGERVVAVQQPAQKIERAQTERERGGRKDFRNVRAGNPQQMHGTPGETKTPKEIYIPPADNRKRLGRSSGKKGNDRRNDARGGRFDERDLNVARVKPIEERILDQIGNINASELKSVRLTEGATVRDFAERLGIIPKDVVQLLIKRGVFATLNQPIGEKLAAELGTGYGYDVSFVPFEEMVIEQEFEELIASESDDVELARAPVVTVMGHVDHGKTSLLDAIRSANVAEGEAGGITQHIGAYSVEVPSADNFNEKRRVVFLDTPGHEAFTMMRARGAKATDVVILVVAADDGVMPQTVEAIEHSKAANVPIIVAINKIDKPDANTDKVKQGLATNGLQPQDWGGDTEMIPVSAKKHENLETLLTTVLLQADIMDLKASPTRRASGVVLESKLDKGRGSVATVLVQQGTLRVGDPFIVGQVHGKVRAMFSDRGEIVTEAAPATPVEVLGLQGVPHAGDTFQVVANIDQAVSIAGQRQMLARQIAMLKTTKRGIESLGQAEVKELLVVLKTDVQGSIEVLRATLEKLSTDKVKVRVIRSGVGAITESDVLLASATQADNTQTAVVIIGFNVRPETRAAEVAKQEEVDIRLHSIIYKVEEEIRAAMIGMLDAIERENILGKALVQEVFKVTKIGTIAGCRVTDGVIRRQAKARLIRDGVVAWEGDISSLKRFKEDASEVRQGFECGIGLVNFNDIKVNDEIEAFVIERIAATEL
ncbi:MAG: translation initiation factor IF-2 [Pyrinomonadaceae bacterium]